MRRLPSQRTRGQGREGVANYPPLKDWLAGWAWQPRTNIFLNEGNLVFVCERERTTEYRIEPFQKKGRENQVCLKVMPGHYLQQYQYICLSEAKQNNQRHVVCVWQRQKVLGFSNRPELHSTNYNAGIKAIIFSWWTSNNFAPRTSKEAVVTYVSITVVTP